MSKSHIHLSKKEWKVNNCTGIGQIFHTDEKKLTAAADVKLSINSACEILRSSNGFFAVIYEESDELIAAVDHLQTYSLYYAVDDETFYLSDSPEWIHSQLGCEESKSHQLEYLLFGYTLGSKTRSEKVKQLQSGEFLIADLSGSTPQVETERYFRYPESVSNPSTQDDRSEDELLAELDEAHLNCFKRLETFADGRPLAVSLSGGYDSRLILLMLVRMGYENVYAFTYGHPNSSEVERAEEIAELLDVPWKHIPYTHEKWYEWFRSQTRIELDEYLGELACVPAEDDALAIEELQSQNWLPGDTIILSGDHVSAISGRLSPVFLRQGTVSERRLLLEILDLYIRWDTRCRWNQPIDQKIRDQIGAIIEITSSMSGEEAAKRFERFGWQERQSKLIPRHGVYEFYGFDWWLPLWDREYVDFWGSVPLELRQGKELHKKYIVNLMAEVTDYSREEARETFESGWSPESKSEKVIDRFDKQIRRYPQLDRIFRTAYFKLARSPPAYDSDPKFGIMSEKFFEELPTGEYYIHGYRILDSLDYISIEEERINRFPSEVSLPRW